MNRAMKAGSRSLWLALAASMALVACGGGGGATNPTGAASATGTGTLRVALTDAPRCRVGNDDLDKVFVTVERVRVHRAADADPASSGWVDIAINPARKLNLLDLTNGRLEELGTVPLPAGDYTQVRLVLSPNRGADPANSLVRAGDMTEIPLRTPSAAQSGLKIIRPFTVQPNAMADLVIDFDACRSIVALGRGNGGYLLKPILSAHLRLVAAIAGFVDPLAGNVTVSAQKDGKVIRSTIPFASATGPYAAGEFVLAYLDPSMSPYDVVITSPARGTSVVASVPVVTNEITHLSVAATPIPLPVAATTPSRLARGTLGPAGAIDTGAVRALQAVGPVPKIEVATTNVDGGDGTYLLTLPTASPLFAAYSATLPLSFASPASPPADFSYTLEASAAGYVTQTKNIGAGTADATWDPTLSTIGP
ncbi:MAG: DUF4382 domain-containing protein [Burkholderiaceae bacterium]|jgi:hypothetical protein|nr:DUF4382 domain-containing protein [Burkholderiaceae bacterium]